MQYLHYEDKLEYLNTVIASVVYCATRLGSVFKFSFLSYHGLCIEVVSCTTVVPSFSSVILAAVHERTTCWSDITKRLNKIKGKCYLQSMLDNRWHHTVKVEK